MPTVRRAWTRDELLVAFNLYCRTPFGRLHRNNPDIIALAKHIERTPSSVAMKLCNFASLDPVHRARNVAGLQNVAAADRAIFDEFDARWEALASESETAKKRLNLESLSELDNDVGGVSSQSGLTETPRMIQARRLQTLFRSTVMASYDFTCAISGINVPALIQASHIVPWSHEEGRRLDPRNGIALSVLHDRAFDRGLITLDEDLRLVISGRLRIGKPTEIHRVALLNIEGRRLRLPTRYAPDPEALAYHREHIFTG
jgi:putative restriction endonuclease